MFTNIIAGLLIGIGLAIMVYCIMIYFRQLSGLKNVDPFLRTNGLHAIVRHPLYSGTFIFIFGLFFLFPLVSNACVFAIIIIYTVWGIKGEEEKLVRIFGDQYIQYQLKVPMIIPFL